MKKDKFKLVTEYPVRKYKCGLKAGDLVVLRKDLIIRDSTGKPTGVKHNKGERWKVLSGSNIGGIDVWFMSPDGQKHTWDDDKSSINKWFVKDIKDMG